jgi:hypothetical protein
MASDLLGKVGLRIVSAAVVGISSVTVSASQASALPVATQAAPHIIRDYGTSLVNTAHAVVADTNNNNNNNNKGVASLAKPAELSGIA